MTKISKILHKAQLKRKTIAKPFRAPQFTYALFVINNFYF